MKRILPLLLLLLALPASAATTTEVLVLTTATELPRQTARAGLEIWNAGPAAIYCAFSSATAVVGKARPIAPGSGWAIDARQAARIWCIASAAQVTGAATIVSEL